MAKFIKIDIRPYQLLDKQVDGGKRKNKFDEFTRDALHDAIITLEKKEYFYLSTPEKLTVLQFLIDEALETPTIAEYINEHEMKMKELKVEKKLE